MKKQKYVGYGTMLWAFLFMCDYTYHLFQIDKSGVVTTILGLRIKTVMNQKGIQTDFSLTYRALLIYVLFIILYTILLTILDKRKAARQ